MKKKIAMLGATGLSLFLMASVALAQTSGNSYGTAGANACASVDKAQVSGIICTIYTLIKIAVPVVIVGGILWFIWGIVQFMTADDAEKRTKARASMVHGIIGLIVIFGVLGLVYIVLNTFNVNNNTANNLSLPSY